MRPAVRFAVFFASLAVHTLGVCIISFRTEAGVPPPSETPFRLFFAGPYSAPAPAPESKKKPAGNPEPRQTDNPAEFIEAELSAGTDETPETSGPSASIKTYPGPDELRRLLRYLIEKKLVYPPLARRRNIEGTAGFDLRIGEQGQLLSGSLARSSGSALLDKAASELIAAVFPLDIVLRESETITISINYTLKTDERYD